jgi:hypothetical protein
VVLALVAVTMVALLGVGALAADIGNLYVARNQLQNAADAGALAGARVLYVNDGTAVNPGANAIASAAAAANQSQGAAAEVVSVERGHWSFATRTFTPNDSLLPTDLWNATTEELDVDPNFINAVRVRTARNATPVQSFFGRVLGFNSYAVQTQAVAYIGYAGRLGPGEADQPIAICRDRLLIGEEYTCTVGWFIPSSVNEPSETGGWSSFEQGDACLGGTNTNDLRPLVCGAGNPNEIVLGDPLATLGGQAEAAFRDLYDCWVAATNKTAAWNMTLPVIECPDQNVGPCNVVVGAVNINVVWINDATNNQENTLDRDAPRSMTLPDGTTWSSSDANGVTRWNSFVQALNLRKPNGEAAVWNADPQQTGWRQKTIYFLPDCTPHELSGRSDGENFGVLARIPVLVD